jgi:hypothetical protein
MPLPSSFLAHLRAAPYHPRSPKHGNALAEAIVTDLLATCKPMASAAAAGEIVWDSNFNLTYGIATWNTDLAVGAPPPGTAPPEGEPIRKTAPSSVHIAVELKSVMTEHRKAIKNRKRDLESHHQHVHTYNESTIAGGVVLLNVAERFVSPLRREGEITVHRDPIGLLEHCLDETRAISVKGGPTGDGLDAKCAIVVRDDNIDVAAASYFEKLPAPQVGDPIHYDAFIQRLCAEWSNRFSS